MSDEIEQMPEVKVCESCGEPFGCGAKLDGCWCTELNISTTTADDPKARFRDCLCPKCLGAHALRSD